FAPHPQMVGDYSVSPDQLTYQFKLRDGLGFHDGSPVRGADCIASIKRWMARDGLGQSLKPVVDEMKPDGDKGFTIKLKEPFPLLLDGLAKASSLALFVMPERLANTDPFQQVTEMVGSGPFKFVKEEFEPGHRVVYVKNTDYVPRKEPPSWASGGKVVKVDRVEWLYSPDAMSKVAALNAGEAGDGCRSAGDGLGHAGDPARLEGADRQGRLQPFRHRLGRRRPARPGAQPRAQDQWRRRVVRLAQGRQARNFARAMDQGDDN